jgi:carboxymethylenebutenolidase
MLAKEKEHTMSLIKEWHDLAVAGGTMRAYVARPAGDQKAPSVIVLQEIFGVNAHIRDVTERVAAEGYVAIAPDYFWRTDPNMELEYNAAGAQRGMSNLKKLDAEQLLQDVKACLKFLQAQTYTTGKVGTMGFCIGGHVAYLAACEEDITATASFYGGGIASFRPGGGAPTVALTTNIRGEILCLFGAKDKGITSDHVDTIRRALINGRIPYEVAVYPDADHAFFCDQRAMFHKVSRDDAWRKVKQFFARTLK